MADEAPTIDHGDGTVSNPKRGRGRPKKLPVSSQPPRERKPVSEAAKEVLAALRPQVAGIVSQQVAAAAAQQEATQVPSSPYYAAAPAAAGPVGGSGVAPAASAAASPDGQPALLEGPPREGIPVQAPSATQPPPPSLGLVGGAPNSVAGDLPEITHPVHWSLWS